LPFSTRCSQRSSSGMSAKPGTRSSICQRARAGEAAMDAPLILGSRHACGKHVFPAPPRGGLTPPGQVP
jgi:hypothetical protein